MRVRFSRSYCSWAGAWLEVSPHAVSDCLFMGKYSPNCLYPALCHRLSLVKWVGKVFCLGRIQSKMSCCEMAGRAFVSGRGACWRRQLSCMALGGMFSRYWLTCRRRKTVQGWKWRRFLWMLRSLASLELSLHSRLPCGETDVGLAGILRVSAHHIQSASAASLTDLSLEKKKKFQLERN